MEFIVVDLVAQRRAACIAIGGHTKGLAVTDDYFVVGSSEFARREGRRVSLGRICFTDRGTLHLMGETDLNVSALPHPIGNVDEVRCLSPGDRSQQVTVGTSLPTGALRLAGHTPWPAFNFALRKQLRRLRRESLYG